jgi:hypothetical protein
MLSFILIMTVGAADAQMPVRVELSPEGSAITHMSWDTESGNRAATNLLNSPAKLVIESNGKRNPAPVRFNVQRVKDGYDLTVPLPAVSKERAESLQLIFPFDPRVSPTTILPAGFTDDGALTFPAIVSAPDFGQMLVTPAENTGMKSRLLGSRKDKTTNRRRA